MISEREVLIRLLLAALLGAIIGFEREYDNQPAGLRTNMILVMGATLAMILSIQVSQQYEAFGIKGDPARLAAQVISGIGFLGAGAILHNGVTIRGLTTAASMWTMAVVGLAVGSGHYYEGATVTLVLFIVLSIVNRWESKIIRPLQIIPVVLWMQSESDSIDNIRKIFADAGLRMDKFAYQIEISTNEVKVQLVFHSRKKELIERVQKELIKLHGLKKIKIGNDYSL